MEGHSKERAVGKSQVGRGRRTDQELAVVLEAVGATEDFQQGEQLGHVHAWNEHFGRLCGQVMELRSSMGISSDSATSSHP